MVTYTCDINNQKLQLTNRTDDPIYYELKTDTFLNTEMQLYRADPNETVKPNFVMGGDGAWEYEINNHSNDSTLYIFIFSTDKITDKVIKNRNYKRFDYKVKDLEALDWKIVIE